MLLNLFRTPTPAQLIDRALQDALRMHLEHSMAAEHHAALRDMYMARTQRLGDQGPTTNVKMLAKGKAA